MYKYKEPLSQEQLDLLDKLSKKDFSNFSEADVREEYIAPILSLLGYEKNTDYEVEREESSDLKWLHIEKAGLQRFDYKFNIRKKYFWLIEAKNGRSQDITRENEEQAYLYSFNPDINCRFFAVCNGWFFNLYDRNKFLSNDEENIFTPILTIKSQEIKERYNELYSYLGSSEIIFKVKEDILLREIKNTLSAEINPDRIKRFSHAVDNIINISATQVLENIRASYNIMDDLEKEKMGLGKFLNTLSLESIIDCIFDGHMTGLRFEAGCKVIKTKLLEYKKYPSFYESKGYSGFDLIFDYLFLNPMRVVKIDYFWNIVGLISCLEMDQELSGMMCRYNRTKVNISELLDIYLFDMFSFFENRPDIRAYIIVYPLYYRIIKSMIYGYGNSIFSHIISKQVDVINYFWTEEELQKIHFTKSSGIIMMSDNMIRKCMSEFNNEAFTRSYNNYPRPPKPTPSSIGEIVNTEIIKRTIAQLDTDLKLIEKEIDIDKIREQSQDDEQDEMFAFDWYYKNPWNPLFMSSITILINFKSGHLFNKNVLDKVKYLVENKFMYVWQYIQMTQKPENRGIAKMKTEIEAEMLNECGITLKEDSEHDNILSTIKYKTWDREEVIQWNKYK